MSNLTTEEFIERARKVYGTEYDYSKTKYKNYETEIIIICKKHGDFKKIAGNHLFGQGCPICSREKRTKKQKQFIKQANNIHNNFYDYSLVEYKTAKKKVEIICPKHGCFKQKPNDHLQGRGCKECGIIKNIQSRTKDKNVFINDAIAIHGLLYDYSQVNYINNNTHIIILCSKHGPYKQTPHCHLNGHGCQKCVNLISKPEIQWLNEMNVPMETRQYNIKIGKKRFKVDGFDPKTNTIYEFFGDFWHGNPKVFDKNELNKVTKKTFGELYDKTMSKIKLLKQVGYNIIYIWESEYNKKQGNKLQARATSGIPRKSPSRILSSH